MEQALAAIAESQEAHATELEQARVERAAASEERERARTGVGRARQEASQMLADARRAADEMLARAEREVAEIRRELTRLRNVAGGRRSLERSAGSSAFDQLAERASRARAAIPAPRDGTAEDLESPEPTDVQPRPGLWGRSRTLGSSGRIVEVSGRTGRITLETDEARIVLPADDVEVVAEPITGPTPRDREADELRRRAASRIAPQLDLRGERVEAALERLAGYVDEALLAGLDEAVIVHGAGTGALRRSIREYLADHPRVRGTRSGRRDEGGDGTTVAEL
jgi:DNA mismatch repair protein MutS2